MAGVKLALILGGARCVFKDQKRALELFTPDLIICINEMGRDYPETFDHWVSMHPQIDKFPHWIGERKQAGRPDAKQLWIPRHREMHSKVKYEVGRVPSWGGSSGMLACTLCIAMLDCDAVLAGVPMQADAAHYHDDTPWTDAVHYHGHWRRYLDKLKGRIKSMSGWTQELLGAPDEEWIRGHQ